MIISITNQKGGVGKTTTAVNLSACLAHFGYKTLIIDLDSQGNTTSNLFDKEIQNSSYELLTKLSCDILATLYKNLDLIPASISLAKFQGDNTQLSKAISKLNYDYIIIDCPPALGSLTINALCASDYVIVPLEASIFALEGTKTLFDAIRIVQQQTGVRLLGTLLTRHDLRTRIAKDLASTLSNNKNLNLFNTIINESVKIKEAQFAGKSIIDYDRYSMPALQYSMFAKEVEERCQKNSMLMI
jgi:chromosome partitioning protein